MKRGRLRTRLLSVAFIVSMIVAWWFLAPSQIGGSARYVITRGISMEPRFHTGDLAIVRPAATYKVGDIVAYRSTLLHVTVLHRIVGRRGNLYVFKGDNNNFLDPSYPTRSELLGKLWLHIPHGGWVLTFVHSPATAAVLCGLLGLFLLGVGQRRRRRRRRARGGPESRRKGTTTVRTRSDHGLIPTIDYGAVLTTAALAGVVFLVLAIFAFSRPDRKPTTSATHYTQQVTFGYHADVPAGPVYPTGAVRTGDPIFLQIVHHLAVQIRYRLTSAAQHSISGTEEVLMRLTGPTGWSRSIVLAPRTHFAGDRTSTEVPIDIRHLQSMLAQVAKLTGVPATGYTISIVARVHVAGIIAGKPVNATYGPALGFGLQALQLMPGASPTGTATSGSGETATSSSLANTQRGSVTQPGTAPNVVKVVGVSPAVSTLRWIAVVGLVLSAIGALLAYLGRRAEPFEETLRIQAQYGHMIVPIVAGEDLGWPAVDVPTIKALARLAESSERLILHSRANDVDTYMVNDDGTVYRYQVKPSKVVWGKWSDTTTPVKAAA